MKSFLFILSLFLLTACGLNEENRRNVKLYLKDGNELNLFVFEKKAFTSGDRTLMIYANAHPVKIRDCADAGFKSFGDEVFFEVIKQNDLPMTKFGKIHLAMPQAAPDKPYCIYSYEKKDNGEWIGEN